MKSLAYKFFLTLSLGVALLTSSGNVNAASYNFFQGGFPDGGYVKGSFSAEDKFTKDYPYGGPDGLIYMCDGRSCYFSEHDEVTNFSIYFGGNSLFESINRLSDGMLRYLLYNIDHNNLEHLSYGSCDTTCYERWMYVGGSKFIDLLVVKGIPFLYTSEPLQVSQVPLPGALGLFIAAILSLSRLARKR